jgi:hypothetical protein
LSITCNIQHLAQQQSPQNYNGQWSKKELLATCGGQIRQINNALNPTTSSGE